MIALDRESSDESLRIVSAGSWDQLCADVDIADPSDL